MNNQEISRALAWRPACIATCLICSCVGVEGRTGDLLGNEDLSSENAQDKYGTESTEAGARLSNLSPVRRQELSSRGLKRIESFVAAAHGRNDGTEPEAAPTAHEPPGPLASTSELTAREVEGVIERDSDTPPKPDGNSPPDLLELWQQFLDSVHESGAGGFAIEDVFVSTEEALINHFLARYASHVDKGLVVPSLGWPREGCSPFCLDPPNLTICWTSDSDATNGDKARVAELVQARWGNLSDTIFDFADGSGNWNSCATAGTWDIRIFQDSSITRGCSSLGTDSAGAGVDCGVGSAHATASMVLPNLAGASAIYVDYTTVHEFGHAIGLAHEQIRLEYNWEDPSLGPHDPGLPRNCSSADDNITYIPSGLFLNDRLVPADIGGQTVGAFDDNSIMYYCQQQETLAAGLAFTDARASEISVGDIFSSHSLYDAQFHEVRFKYSSWYDSQVQLHLEVSGSQSENFMVNAEQSPQVLATERFGMVGSDYTVSAIAVNDERLTCTAARPQAVGVFNGPRIIPPAGFQTQPVLATCYDVAVIVAAL